MSHFLKRRAATAYASRRVSSLHTSARKVKAYITESPRSSCIALDPGVRTFMTGYDPTFGHVFEFAQDDHKRLVRLALRCDKLYSKIATE